MNETKRLCPARTQTARGQNASVGKRFVTASRAVATIGLLVMAAGCVARPVGDFGRAAPSWTHDDLMPTVGKWRAKAGKEPVSTFNDTDQETEMHNRVWRFLVSGRTKDWFYDTAVELQRTRLTGATDHNFKVDRYYNWLQRTRYESSRVRYASVQADIEADIATVPDTFAAICAVIEVDRQRAIAGNSLYSGDANTQIEIAGRKGENDQFIDWFVRALRYRYDSYSFALDRLLVETPHEEGEAVDARLREMESYVLHAESRDFCAGKGGRNVYTGQTALPARVLMNRDREVVDQK